MFKSILMAIDLDDPTFWSQAIPAALSLARAGGPRLTLGIVITNWEAMADQWSPASYRVRIEIARVRLCSLADGCGHEPHDVMVGGGRIGPAILELAGRADADLIVLAAHWPGLRDYVIRGERGACGQPRALLSPRRAEVTKPNQDLGG
ncbi:universal stress protein [Sphingobium aromaticiconvertens]|uniref:universal stress protein n=1 Tax=Sphingobium aromaticiconvertens TaxID=365341 RepID=UPI003015F5D1